MDTLLRMQSSYDIAQTRLREKHIRVRRYEAPERTKQREYCTGGIPAARTMPRLTIPVVISMVVVTIVRVTRILPVDHMQWLLEIEV